MTDTIDDLSEPVDTDEKKTRLIAAGGILGALGASACCVVPLILFSLGISGAWISNLTALAPYKPIFITITFGFWGMDTGSYIANLPSAPMGLLAPDRYRINW
ncbi:MAG: hypothetical protein JKY41_04030 [Rhodobacteraceae bacterium]|nr:hypothetical protein [Paracoccaceae bacterium]